MGEAFRPMQVKGFQRVEYKDLNARQQENYNFQKIGARLADYGFNCLRLSDDWQGADFIACHFDGQEFLKVQLKGRLTFESKYRGKAIYIAFLDQQRCYVYPHDELQARVFECLKALRHDQDWVSHGNRSWPSIPKFVQPLLDAYEL